MTEAVNPETTEEVTDEQAETASQKPELASLGVLGPALVEAATPKVEEIKAIAAKQASAGDVGKLMTEAIEQSTDAEVVKRREAIQKANEAINKFTKEMEAILRPSLKIPSEAELAEMDTQYKTLAAELDSFNKAFTSAVGKNYPDLTLFDYVGEIPGKRRGAKAGQGTGTARPRVSSVEYTKDLSGETGWVKAEKEGKSSFSHLIQAWQKETKQTISAGDLHAAWLESQKVKEWTDTPEVSTFTYSFTDDEGKSHQYWVRVTR